MKTAQLSCGRTIGQGDSYSKNRRTFPRIGEVFRHFYVFQFILHGLIWVGATSLYAQHSGTFSPNGKGPVDALGPVGTGTNRLSKTVPVARIKANTNSAGEQILMDNVSVPQAGATLDCLPPACSVNGPDYVCDNTAGIIYTAPPGMSAYQWSISGAGSIPGSTTGQSVSVTSGDFPLTYTVYVTITDGGGCNSTCSKVSDIFLLKPPANITVSPNPACFGVTLDLSIVAAASSTVSWSGEGVTNPSGTFAPTGDGYWYYNQTTANPTTTGAHTYSVVVTSEVGCSNTGTATVMVHPAPPACSITGPSSACAGSTGNVYSAPGGMNTYEWSVSGSGTIVGPNGGSSVTVTAGAGGTYTVSVTLADANGCTSTCSQPVTINALPNCTITGPPPSPGPSNDTLCTSLQYVFTAPPGMSSYKWGVSSNGTINGSATGSSVTITVNSGLHLTVRDTVTDANGCTSTCSLSRPVQPAPTCSVSGPLTVCGGSTGNVYTVSSNAGPTGYYVWSISGSGVITSATSGYNLTSVTVTAGASGSYTITAATKFSFNTCLKTCSETVTIGGCCEFMASCPTNTNLGAYNCTTLTNIPAMPTTLAQIQAAPYNITLGANPCGQIKFTASDNATPNTCSAANQTITRTIVVWDDLSPFNGIKDPNEASQTCTFTYVVQADKTSPQFTACPAAPIDLGCNPTPPNADKAKTDAGAVTDNCGVPTKSATGGPITGACVKTQIWTVTATDGCNNTATCLVTYTWKSDTESPSFTACPAAPIDLGCNPTPPNADKAKTDAGAVTDNCSVPTKSATGGPVTGACMKTQTWTVTATDGCGNTATCSVTYNWKTDTQKPDILDKPDYTLPGCNPVWPTLTTTWTDNCAGNGNITATAGVVQTSGCTQWRVYTFTTTDGCGNTDVETTTVTRNNDITPPSFTSVPANVTVQCNALPAVGTPVATDNCGAPTMMYLGQTRTDGACPDNYMLTRTWKATDACGSTRTATQKITVVDTQKPAFTFVPAPVTIECSDPVPPVGSPAATDNCDATVTITLLGQYMTSAPAPNAYLIVRVWKATDNCGLYATASQVITVQDTQKPVFTSVPPAITIECSDPFPTGLGTATATDNCDASVQVSFNGQTSAPGSCPPDYVVTRSWVAYDDYGNTQTATQTITVLDTHAPVFTNAPANVTIACGANIPPVPVVSASDACDNSTPVAYAGEVNTGPNCPYTITRSWTVADDCGNATTHIQVITVSGQSFNGSGSNAQPATRHTIALQLAPNPAEDEVWASFDATADGAISICLLSLDGRLLKQQQFPTLPGANRLRLDLSGMVTGVYVVRLSADGQVAAEKLVVFRN